MCLQAGNGLSGGKLMAMMFGASRLSLGKFDDRLLCKTMIPTGSQKLSLFQKTV